MRVLMMGNREDVKGGISSVISQIRGCDWRERGVSLVFIPTYTDVSKKEMAEVFGKACVELIRRLRGWKPDLVYVHMSYKGSFVRAEILQQICTNHHAKMVVHVHGSSIEEWYMGLPGSRKKHVSEFFEKCARVIVLGEHYRKFIHSIAPKANVSVLCNTVEEQTSDGIIEDNVSYDTKKMILYMGVLTKRKGVGDLIRAFERLHRSDDPDLRDTKLVIAGDGELKGELVDTARSLNLWDDAVEFTGWAEGESKDALYKKASVFVLPSYHEGLPMAVLEAMSFGLPVVATNVGDIKEAVSEGENGNGFLVEPGDVDQLADALRTLIKNPQMCSDYGKAAREKIHDKFNAAAYADRLYTIWKSAKESET